MWSFGFLFLLLLGSNLCYNFNDILVSYDSHLLKICSSSKNQALKRHIFKVSLSEGDDYKEFSKKVLFEKMKNRVTFKSFITSLLKEDTNDKNKERLLSIAISKLAFEQKETEFSTSITSNQNGLLEVDYFGHYFHYPLNRWNQSIYFQFEYTSNGYPTLILCDINSTVELLRQMNIDPYLKKEILTGIKDNTYTHNSRTPFDWGSFVACFSDLNPNEVIVPLKVYSFLAFSKIFIVLLLIYLVQVIIAKLTL